MREAENNIIEEICPQRELTFYEDRIDRELFMRFNRKSLARNPSRHIDSEIDMV
jgi:hypothetical protein